jgi:hypothetical protein
MATDMTATFLPGIELARLYYAEAVRPLLDDSVPPLPHAAALIGPGSEVLGFDTPRSTDHDWGPRCQLFLAGDADPGLPGEIAGLLARRLPARFRGYPTVFPASKAPAGATPSHWVEVAPLGDWCTTKLGFDPRAGLGLHDWLATPTQLLAEVTGGAVFHDGLAAQPGGGIAAARLALAWYPDDLWRYVLACQWQRIDQEEPFAGRCAEARDDLGSALVAARLSRDLARLTLLMQRVYPPYSKWLGTALARTPAGARLVPLLTRAATAGSWRDREDGLCACYQAAAELHNDLGLTGQVDPAVRPSFYDRPYRVLGAARFARALLEAISDERIRALPLTGAVDQLIDSTDALTDRRLRQAGLASTGW